MQFDSKSIIKIIPFVKQSYMCICMCVVIAAAFCHSRERGKHFSFKQWKRVQLLQCFFIWLVFSMEKDEKKLLFELRLKMLFDWIVIEHKINYKRSNIWSIFNNQWFSSSFHLLEVNIAHHKLLLICTDKTNEFTLIHWNSLQTK